MSQRFPVSRPSSRSSPDDDRKIRLPCLNTLDDYYQRKELPEWQNSVPGKREYDSHLHPPSQPPPTKVPGVERDFGVHSMLNPSLPSSNHHPARQPFENSELMILNSDSRLQHRSGDDNESWNLTWEPRRLLNPQLPALMVYPNRPGIQTSLDTHGSPLSGLSKQTFNSGPSSSTESEDTLDPIPLASGQNQLKQRYAKDIPKHGLMGAPGSSSLQSSTGLSASLTSSSSTSTPSSYHLKTTQKSPPFSLHQNRQTSSKKPYYHPCSNFGSSMQFTGLQGPSVNPEGPYSTPVAKSQGTPNVSSNEGISRQTSASDPIHVLTMTTNQSLYTTIPVDVYHASRLADEKRARNAGASARFRQRRKEKEKEANLAIEKLKSQVKDLERNLQTMKSECDFYRSDRDRLRDILYRTPETRYLAIQAPQSPQTGKNESSQGKLSVLAPVQTPATSYQETSWDGGSRKRRSRIGEGFTEASSVIPSAAPQSTGPSGFSVNDIIQSPE